MAKRPVPQVEVKLTHNGTVSWPAALRHRWDAKYLMVEDHGTYAVVRPMTVAGLRTSIRGRRAARWNSASAEICGPGQITPPRYSPRAEMASKVVAVPKSTTMIGCRGLGL